MISVDNIKTKGDLIKFIKQLEAEAVLDDCPWENRSLDSYFEAMAGWLDDVDDANLPNMVHDKNEPIWRVFAYILEVATIYE